MFFKKKAPKADPLASYPDTTDAGTPFRNKIEKELYFTKPEYKKLMDEKDRDNMMFQNNVRGIESEKNDDTEEAIAEYEKNVAAGFDGSHPYKRLAIIYRKQKRYDDEIRVLKAAVKVFSKNNTKLEWFSERLKKAQELKAKG